MGASSSGVENDEDPYIMNASYSLMLEDGSEILMTFPSVSWTGIGFDDATLSITVDSRGSDGSQIASASYDWFFDTIEELTVFLSDTTDLGTYSGATTIDIALVETLAGINDSNALSYQLAIADSASITWQTSDSSNVPLPGSLLLFVTGFLLLAGFDVAKRRKML